MGARVASSRPLAGGGSQPKTLRPPRPWDWRRSSPISSASDGPLAWRSRRRACWSSRRMASSRSSWPSLALADCRLQHGDGLVVDLGRHRERMPVLAAMGEGEARRIGEPAGRAVDDFGHHAPASAPCARRRPAPAGGRRNRPGPASRRCRQRAVQAAEHDVAGSDVVMRGHHQVRQQRLLRRGRRRCVRQCRNLTHDAIGTEVAQQIELSRVARPRPGGRRG